MKKPGRPIKDNPSSKVVSIRMTEAEYQKLEEYAKKHQMTITDALKVGMKKLIK